jgi:hypothetical protein
VPVAVTSCKDGLEALTILEVERQKVGDALERQKSFMIYPKVSHTPHYPYPKGKHLLIFNKLIWPDKHSK